MAQGEGMWQFEDGRSGSENWKKYAPLDAGKLAACRASPKASISLTNRWGTYRCTLHTAGTQQNSRTGATRSLRLLMPWEDASAASHFKIVAATSNKTNNVGQGNWQFEDGAAGSGNFKNYAPKDNAALHAAVAAGKRVFTINNNWGTYEVTFFSKKNGSQKNVKTGAKRSIRCGNPPMAACGNNLFNQAFSGGYN